eukprot:2030176-Rhodomonas_salina.1
MGLTKLRSRKWYIQSTNARTGDGLCEGLGWLSSNLPKTHASTLGERQGVRLAERGRQHQHVYIVYFSQ